MLARYDLDYELATFDFFGWGVMAIAAGATGIIINANPKVAINPERIASIIRPGAELFGVPVTYGRGGERIFPERWKLKYLIEFTQQGKIFSRLKSSKEPRDVKYTVTLRNYHKDPHRNSDEDLWRRFAKEIGALVIEDYTKKKISFHDRMALYAGARMNFGVWGGPMFLLTLTNYPVIATNWGVDETAKLNKWGIKTGDAVPWLLSNQVVPWMKASHDSLRQLWRDYELRREEKMALSCE